jgi:short subunit dehydrogenase-like uncharacterized protein
MTASSVSPWMIYGAYGFTGRLIVEQAVRRGHKPILAGRDRQKVEALANRYGLQWQAVSLDDAVNVRTAIQGKSLILNAAGPFSQTGWRLIDACLSLGTSYMDVSGEFSHLRSVEALDGRARQAGIALLTGGGFGTTYGDCLAAYALEKLPKVTALRLSVAAANALTTPGAQRTIVSVLADGGYIVSGGRFERRPLAHQSWIVRTTDSDIAFASAPLGEVAALRRSTGIADIVVGRPMSRFTAAAIRLSSPLLQRAFKAPAIRRFVSRDRGAALKAPPPGGWRSRLWLEANDSEGNTVLAQLETGEGYAAAAEAALANAEGLLSRNLLGAFTPGSAFGVALLSLLPNAVVTELGSRGVLDLLAP